MGTSSHPGQGGAGRRRVGYRRPAVLAVAAGVLLASILASKSADKAGASTAIAYVAQVNQLHSERDPAAAYATVPARAFAEPGGPHSMRPIPKPPPPRPPSSSGRGYLPPRSGYSIPQPYRPSPYVPRYELPKWHYEPPRLVVPELLVPLEGIRAQVPRGVEFQSQTPGQWAARKDIDKVAMNWPHGQLDRMRRALESTRGTSQSADGLPTVKDGVLYGYQDAGRQMSYRVGGPDASWLSITKDLRPPGKDTVFRLEAAQPRAGEPRHYHANLAPPPAAGGGSRQWIHVAPATADRAAQARPAQSPGDGARAVLVTTPDSRIAFAGRIGDQLWARGDDPVLGLNGTLEGAALLRDFSRIDEAMRSAAAGRDSWLRGVGLGKGGEDGVALVDAHSVMVVTAGHRWADRVLQAIGFNPAVTPLIGFERGHAVHVDRSELTISPAFGRRQMSLDEVRNTTRGDIYLHERFRSTLVFDNGAFIPHTLPRDTRVIVQEAVAADRTSVLGATPPDIRIHEGTQWLRMGNAGAGTSNGQILLVCPDRNERLPGCER